jgi:hypothetical protein
MLLLLISLMLTQPVLAGDFDPTRDGFFGASAADVRSLIAQAETQAAAEQYAPLVAAPAVVQHAFDKACVRGAIRRFMRLPKETSETEPRVLYSSQMSDEEFATFSAAYAEDLKAPVDTVSNFFHIAGNTIYLSDRPTSYQGRGTLDGSFAHEYTHYLQFRHPAYQPNPHDAEMAPEAQANAVQGWFYDNFVAGDADPCTWQPAF